MFVYGVILLKHLTKLEHKKGRILKSKNDILNIIKNDLNNDDYLMIKGSNSTGLNQITKLIGSKY